jgi:hypothetical protein
MGLRVITTITVEEHRNHRLNLPYFIAYAGSGVWQMQAMGVNKWDAVGFLVSILVKSPSYLLATSVDVLDVASR